ncbi:MAG: class I SAM-dependent methyltransferase [Oscillospiraceae bacterium]|nr:class I SAM-dependent methyltransferase [Oscillospiraceae bacterium]
MDNKSAFSVNQYDENVRKVIPFYDEIYRQIFDLIDAYYGNQKISVLDTGCGTGTFGLQTSEKLNLSRLVLCDPSEPMIADAKKKLKAYSCEFMCIGSENLNEECQFDIITAIQSHHYFNRAEREKAVINCFHALNPKGMFIYFENTAPFSEIGKTILLKH